MAQNEQTTEEHSTLEQQSPGRLDHPAWCVHIEYRRPSPGHQEGRGDCRARLATTVRRRRRQYICHCSDAKSTLIPFNCVQTSTCIRWLVDWAAVLRPARHKIDHFGDVSPSQSHGLEWKITKPNTTKSARSPIKRNALQQKINPPPKKTKARFSSLLRHPACKRSGSILKGSL